jgi:hypothetical protein
MAYLHLALYGLLAIIALTPLAVMVVGLCISAVLALSSFKRAWSKARATYRIGDK